jgi:hypothetical protein
MVQKWRYDNLISYSNVASVNKHFLLTALLPTHWHSEFNDVSFYVNRGRGHAPSETSASSSTIHVYSAFLSRFHEE